MLVSVKNDHRYFYFPAYFVRMSEWITLNSPDYYGVNVPHYPLKKYQFKLLDIT